MRSCFLALVSSLALGACGGTATATPDAGSPRDTGTPSDTGAPNDTGAPSDSSTASDTGIADTTYMLAPGDCFTFATATSMGSMSMTCGDLQSLGGDLSTPDSGICLLTGTFTSVSAVPTSYESCAWSSYLEVNLSDGLADRGLIVRDASQTHHYRLHVVESAPSHPVLVFGFAPID